MYFVYAAGGKLIVWSLRSIWAYQRIQNISKRSNNIGSCKTIILSFELPIELSIELLLPIVLVPNSGAKLFRVALTLPTKLFVYAVRKV